MRTTLTAARITQILAGCTYLLIVIYASLVPLNFQGHSLAEAWRTFQSIQDLNLGIGSRAYWIANILLYIPLSFIWLSIFSWSERTAPNIGSAILVLCAATAISACLEFAQLFFPPRTVSMNDLVAAGLGSLTGLLLWGMVARPFNRWYSNLSKGRDAAFFIAVVFYIIGLLAFSLLPFDFVVSRAEFFQRLAIGNNSGLFSSASCDGGVRCAASLWLELFAVFPIGLLVAKATKFSRASTIAIALLTGAALGIATEAVQMFLYSGPARGISILTRAAGVGLGALTFLNKDLLVDRTARFFHSRSRVRRLALLAAPVYLIALISVQNWRINLWLDWDTGLARLEQIRFIPFYYHYYTTETAAVRSLVAIVVAYAPIGAIMLWFIGAFRKNGLLLSAIAGGLTAAVFEFIKLFQSSLRPDPTNVLLAAAAACAGFLFTQWLSRLSEPDPAVDDDASRSLPAVEVADEHERTSRTSTEARKNRITWLTVLSIGVLIWAVIQYPLNSYWLVGALMIYFSILWLWPQAWILILPAALPVLDLAPFTGRFYFDELDILLVATLAFGAGWAAPDKQRSLRLAPMALLALTLFALSTVSAILIGAYPFPAPDLNSFNNYFSSYNGVRIAKGLLWVLILLPLIRNELVRHAARTHRLFALGMTLGVLAASVVVVAERLAFTGLFDMSAGYRVVGTFSGMHTGGAFIEGYLATALAFVVWWTKKSGHWAARLFGAAVFVLGCYAMMVTYARGGYLALIVSIAVFGIALLFKKKSLRASQVVAATILLLMLAAVTLPFVQSNAMQSRFSMTERDMHARVAQWRDAIHMMNDNLMTDVFGMGLGRYPVTYFFRNTERIVPASFLFKREADNIYLELGAGESLYFEQIVNLQPGKRYQLRFAARASADDAALSVPVCEKWMLYSAKCVWLNAPVGNTNGQWKNFALTFDISRFGSRPWYAKRPIKLSMSNSGSDSVLAVDNVSLNEATGPELLRNGSFQQGMDHWFFSTDHYDAWHLENTWVQIYFEQGAIGLLLFILLLAVTAVSLIRQNRETDLSIPALAAALAGFLTVATVNSLFDYSRMGLLFYLIIALALLRKRKRRRQTSTSSGAG